MRFFKITVDSREQAKLPLPKMIRVLDPSYLASARRSYLVQIETEIRPLGCADFGPANAPVCIYGHGAGRGAGVVERKFSIDELAGNVFSPVKRANFVLCLRNMRAAWPTRALLLLDGGWDALYNPRIVDEETASMARDAIQRLSLEYQIPIIPLGSKTPASRQRIGDWLVRWLFNCSITSVAP